MSGERTAEEYDQSLLRLYAGLGRATTYRAIIDAVQPEIERMLGYKSIWLQLVVPGTMDLLVLDAGGQAEASIKALLHDESDHLHRHGEEFLVLPIAGEPFLTEIIEYGGVFVADDARTYPATNKDIIAITGQRTVVCVPLRLAERTLGYLNTGTFFDEGVVVPNQLQRQYLEMLSHHAAVAVDRVRFLGERKDAEEALERMVGEMEFRTFLLDSVIDGVIVRDPEDMSVLYVNDAMCGLTGQARENLEATRDVDWVVPEERDAVRRHYESVMRFGTGTTETYSDAGPGGRVPVEIHSSVVSYRARHALASVVSDISERKAVQFTIEQMALHDPLTGLANRALLMDRLSVAIAHARRTRELLAVLFIDVDHFKTINDTVGHGAGDLVLQAVAARLERSVRADDTIARLGGDEFALVLPDIGSEADACCVAQKILAGLREPLGVGLGDISVTASIGLALHNGDDLTGDDLLRDADLAMYRAKEIGRNTYQLFEPSMNETALERFVLKSDLQRAIARNELSLHYQPVVSLENGAIIGAEALCRWTHPIHGAVPPAMFIPLAEESGMICALGEWVLHQACAEARSWADAGHPGLLISVNLSPRQMCEEDLADEVRRALDATGLDPRLLALELTETVAMRDAPRIVSAFRELRETGVRIAIDDFGTGYSSLDYLKQLPVDALKVDRGFVRDLCEDAGCLAIATAIVSLGRALGLDVIAEGVETEAQREVLVDAGCEHAQASSSRVDSRPRSFARCLPRAVCSV
jgi:diguanylate cyclase (GGDEF)-like protein/PAS domain S-box-containing protein